MEKEMTTTSPITRGNAPRIAILALLGLFLGQGPATAACGSSYSFSHGLCAGDHYVPDNLLEVARRAEDKRLSSFWRRLDCRSEGEGSDGRITCMAGGRAYNYDWQRTAALDPVVILVPVDTEPLAYTEDPVLAGAI